MCFLRVILYKRYGTQCGSLAQLGEQRPYKAWVVGSSPSTSTILFNYYIWRGSEVAKRG